MWLPAVPARATSLPGSRSTSRAVVAIACSWAGSADCGVGERDHGRLAGHEVDAHPDPVARRSQRPTGRVSPVQASSSHGTARGEVVVSQTSCVDAVQPAVLGVPRVGDVVEVDVAEHPAHGS